MNARRTPLVLAALLVAVSLGVLAMNVPREGDEPRCAVDRIAVDSCRPWLGATAWGYSDAEPGVRAQVEAHERRIGQRLDLVHLYAGPQEVPLASDAARYFAGRADTMVFQNWKPARRWKKAAGGDDRVNARIDRAADSVKAVGPRKVFLTLHHEPENDVGRAGSAADYVAMWRNVRKRFDARGVDNVVWAIHYMNYSGWDDLVPQLYPGDEFVDWVTISAYRGKRLVHFDDVVRRFQRVVARMDAIRGTHAGRKPLGLAEWGVSDATQQQVRAYYEEAREAVEQNRFPRLKAYIVFDHPGPKRNGGLRVGYTDDGTSDRTELDTYRDFAAAVKSARRPPS